MRKKVNPNLKLTLLIIITILLPVFVLTIGFSALSTSLTIDGKSIVNPVELILVMSITPDQSTAVHNVSASHGYTDIQVTADLPSLTDEVKYKVVIKNLGQSKEILSEIINEEFTNENMTYTITGTNVGDVFLPGQAVELEITFKYKQGAQLPDNNRLNTRIKFVFDNYAVPLVTGYFKPFNGEESFYGFNKSSITGFKRNTNITLTEVLNMDGVQKISNLSADQYNSQADIYGWVDSNGVFNWWSSADIVYFHPNTLRAFKDFSNIISIDLTDTSTEKVENFAHWFDKDRKLKTITGKINTRGLKLQYNDSFDYYNDNDNDSSSGYGLTYMFNDCNELTSVDLSEIVTTNASDMKRMFGGCKKLTEIDVSNFDTSNVRSMYWMFRTCTYLTEIDLSSFDTSNVVNMFGMFVSDNRLTKVTLGSNFDTSNVKYLTNMFYGNSSLTTINARQDFIVTENTDSTNMFLNNNKLIGAKGTEYATAFSKYHITAEYAKISSPEQAGYFTQCDENLEYTIEYDLDGGTANNPTSYYSQTPTFTLVEPVKTGYTFIGWTGSNGNTPQKTVTITKGTIGNKHYEAHYTVNSYIIQYDSNGGTGTMPLQDCTYDQPVTLKNNNYINQNHSFMGWNTAPDGSGTSYLEGQEVTNLATSGTITLYALWMNEASFTKVFNAGGPCTFNGNNSNITGDSCLVYANNKSINTGISLFSSENINKDFEISLTIDHYLTSEQTETQATLLNVKYENSAAGYPGFTVRRNGNNLELTSRFGSDRKSVAISPSTLVTLKIARKDKVIYYSINNQPYVLYQDISSFTTTFETPTTFGSSLNSNNVTPMRVVKNTTFSNMYIKLGTMESINTQ